VRCSWNVMTQYLLIYINIHVFNKKYVFGGGVVKIVPSYHCCDVFLCTFIEIMSLFVVCQLLLHLWLKVMFYS